MEIGGKSRKKMRECKNFMLRFMEQMSRMESGAFLLKLGYKCLALICRNGIEKGKGTQNVWP